MSRSTISGRPQFRSFHRSSAPTCLVLLAALLLPGAVVAEDPKPILDPDAVRLQVEEGQRWLLTISGPDGFYARAELDGDGPALSLAASDGSPPGDGSYVWELRRLDARSGARAAARSGTFHVRDGRTLTAAPELPEESASRDALARRLEALERIVARAEAETP